MTGSTQPNSQRDTSYAVPFIPHTFTAVSNFPSELIAAASAASEADFFRQTVAAVRSTAEIQSVGLWRRSARGDWEPFVAAGATSGLSSTLAEQVTDEGLILTDRQFALSLTGLGGLYILAGEVNAQAASQRTWFGELGRLLTQCWQLHHSRRTATESANHFRALLELSRSWNRHQETNQLLEEMAEKATDLLDSERATIFLWDRETNSLVGRPALGIESGELRIADDTGLVGQVVKTGKLRRVDPNFEQEQRQIDRSVDAETGFQTKSLLCAPLVGSDGKILGAFEMINKLDGAFTDQDGETLLELAALAAQAIENSQQYEQLLRSRDQHAEEAAQGVSLVGHSPAVDSLRRDVQRVAKTDLAVLILGENGTGKEVVSRLIHLHSERRKEPFVAVNCAAISETLLESELFGHEAGAFTDARETRIGKFELASGGTLFLDEIGDMSLGGQAKLLRVLEEKVVVRVGGSVPIHTDARVLAATNQDLGELVRAKRFREDLFFRLNVVTLNLPPLRERQDDVLLLAEHFLADFASKARRTPPRLAADARRRLRTHSWPGNVRELRNMMERLAYLATGDTITVEDLDFLQAPSAQEMPPEELPLSEATRHFQVSYIHSHIQRHQGNMTDTARSLGLHRSNLYRKMKQLDMKDQAREADAEQ